MDDWDSILGKDENIIWQGRPSTKFRFMRSMMYPTFFGMAFAGFALVWIILVASDGGFGWTFGLFHFSAGASVVIVTLFKPSYVRRHTWYTLTNKRGYIATHLPLQGRKLRSYPIGPNTGIELVQGRIPSIFFGSRPSRRNKRHVEEPDGFELISDAPEVMRLIRDIQDPSNHLEAP